MDDLFVFSYVEDEPSKEVLIKVVEEHNRLGARKIMFHPGFPAVKGGFGEIRKRCPAFLEMAAAGRYSLLLTDLDAFECPVILIDDWFFGGSGGVPHLPPEVVFRVAVREVEAWIMADKDELAKFLGISPRNFIDAPETLPDPKQFLLNILRRKATKKSIKDMLPTGSAHIGPTYNVNLCAFIREGWSVKRACLRAPSLKRALAALGRL